MHGGQESTLITMAIPLLHPGMIWCGVPYSEKALSTTTRGGPPYGPTQVAGDDSAGVLDADEATIARAFGARIADIAHRLARR